MQHSKGHGLRQNNTLNDSQRFTVYKWIEALGNEQAWRLTATELAIRFTAQDSFKATENNMVHARNVVFPRPKPQRPIDRVAELEKRISELEQRFVLK